MSAYEASVAANAGSLASSSAWKRRFSSRSDLAGPHPLERVLGAQPERVAGHRHVPPEQLGQPLPDRPQAQAVGDLAVRAAEVAREDDLGARLDQRHDRRDRGPDARVVGDLAVRQRDVEVDAHEDALAGDVRVADREFVHAVVLLAGV